MFLSMGELLAILEDGRWHPISEFITLGHRFPPEIASKAYVNRGERGREFRKKQSFDTQVSHGRRIAIERRLADLVYRDLIRYRGRIDTKEYQIVEINNDRKTESNYNNISTGTNQQ